MNIYAKTSKLHYAKNPFSQMAEGTVFLVLQNDEQGIVLQEVQNYQLESLIDDVVRLATGCTLDFTNRVATDAAGNVVPIRTREWQILTLLCLAKGNAVPYSVLARDLVGDFLGTSTGNMIRVYVKRLRQALGNGAIRTIHKYGLSIVLEDSGA